MNEGINGSADLLHIQKILLIYFAPVKAQLLQYNPTLDLMHYYNSYQIKNINLWLPYQGIVLLV